MEPEPDPKICDHEKIYHKMIKHNEPKHNYSKTVLTIPIPGRTLITWGKSTSGASKIVFDKMIYADDSLRIKQGSPDHDN